MASQETPKSVNRAGVDLVSDGLASVVEAQRFLSLSRAKLYSLMDAGELPYGKIGRARRIPWQALRSYAACCMQK